jgi:hypothetical protein
MIYNKTGSIPNNRTEPKKELGGCKLWGTSFDGLDYMSIIS